MSLTDQLRQYGLSEKEAKIYLFLLQKLQGTAFEIAQGTDIPRATVYDMLTGLKNTGLISSFKKNNVAYFTPESPNRLKELLEEKNRALEAAMPGIKALIDAGNMQPAVKFYAGKEGIKIIFEDILETCKREKAKHIYVIDNAEFLRLFPRYAPDWIGRRITAGIFTHLIVPEELRGVEDYTSNNHRETRFMSNRFPINGALNIYGNKTAFISRKDGEVYSILIESAAITDIIKPLYMAIWESLKVSK